MIDWLLLALFFAAYIFNKNALPSLAAYFLCVAYQQTLFDYHSAIVNHLIYSLIFISLSYFATLGKQFYQAYAICAYSLFHALYAVDWLVSDGYETLFSGIYSDTQIILALCLVYFSVNREDNGIINKHPLNSGGGLGNIWHIQLYSKT